MKTEVIIEEQKEHEWKFPLLAKSKDDKMGVLFGEERNGTVVFSKDSSFDISYRNDSWVSVFDGGVWQILKGKVTIEFDTEL